MANALTPLNKEYWAANMQRNFFKTNVGRELCDTHYESVLTDGDTLNIQYTGYPRIQTYTKGSGMTVDDRYATNEQLSVGTIPAIASYYDDVDKVQNSQNWVADESMKAQQALNNNIDQAVFSEYSNAGSNIYAADVGGSGATTAITLNTSAINPIMAAFARKLSVLDVDESKRFVVLGPKMREQLNLYISGKDTNYADQVGMHGLITRRFGFDIYYSNNLPFTATLGMAAVPTVLDTVTINGAVLEFATDADVVSDDSYIGVLRTGVADTDRIALTAAINNSGTAGTTYSDPDAENDDARWKLTKAGVVATNDSGADTMTIVAYGDIAVSETFTDGTDAWTAQKQYVLSGIKGAIMLLVQKKPNVSSHDTGGQSSPKLGINVLSWTLYGKKTPHRMESALAVAHIDASSWT